jgi:hypothetical protein
MRVDIDELSLREHVLNHAQQCLFGNGLLGGHGKVYLRTFKNIVVDLN